MRHKYVFVAGVWLLAIGTAAASISTAEAKRLQNAAAVVADVRDQPDNGIPAKLWDRAACVVVLPDLKKAAFGIGGEYGRGVMSCKSGERWSAPVFMKLAKGSVGFQIGGEETDLVLLIMNGRGAEKLFQDKVSLGADVSVAAGPVGRTGAAATDAQLHAEMLAYSRSRGVFAGIDLSGGSLHPDKDADARAYGKEVNARDIVMGTARVTMPQPAVAFVNSLKKDTRATTGQK